MALRLVPLHDGFGAEVFGVNASLPIDSDTSKALKEAFLHYQLLLLRDQCLTPEEHVAFSWHFGEPVVHPLDQYLLPDNPAILVISNVIGADGQTEGLDEADVIEWHSDFFWHRRPSIGSLLYARAIPPEGGDTLFASMARAWDVLPTRLQNRIAGLRARRSLDYLTENERKLNSLKPALTDTQKHAAPPVDHPLIRTHPATGRRSIFISQLAIEEIYGLSDADKEALLLELFAHSTAPGMVYRHKWRSGDILVWDNRCTIHTVTPCGRKHARVLHRTTLAGEAVEA